MLSKLNPITHRAFKSLISKAKIGNDLQKPLDISPNNGRELIEKSLSDNSEKLTDVSLFLTNFDGSFSPPIAKNDFDESFSPPMAQNDSVAYVKEPLGFKDHLIFIKTVLFRSFRTAIISCALIYVVIYIGQLLF